MQVTLSPDNTIRCYREVVALRLLTHTRAHCWVLCGASEGERGQGNLRESSTHSRILGCEGEQVLRLVGVVLVS